MDINDIYVPDLKRKKSSASRNRRVSNTFIYIILVIMSVIWLIPFVLILIESFRTFPTSIVGNPFESLISGVEYKWGFDNYINLFTFKREGAALPSFVQWYLNTLIIALACAVLQTFMVLTMSYTLSRGRFKGRKALMNFMLVLGMFPGFLTMVVLYYVLKYLGLTQANAVPGLILVYFASSGMGYYVSKGFFDTVPKSLDEAARIDGANRAQVFLKIILPMAKPIVIYTVLTAFMAPWADYIFASYIAFGSEVGRNVAVGLYEWLTKDMINQRYTMFCAGGVLIAIPITIVFMFLQKYYVEGVTGGAVKG